jgi:DNA-binding MarR family transcriptional regulator
MDSLADPLEITAIADALRPALMRISRRLRQEASKAGLSAQDALILGFIQHHPGVGVCELADAEHTSRPTMSSHVKRLEAEGWLTRSEDLEDGRRSGLAITPSGARRIEAIRRHRSDWLAARLRKLTPLERKRLAEAAEPLLKLVSVEP